jgi:hypothetical protein
MFKFAGTIGRRLRMKKEEDQRSWKTESIEDKENEDEISSKDQVKRGMRSQVFVKGGV